MVQLACDVMYSFADKTRVDLPLRQRSALGAHVPQSCSGTVRWRTVSATEALERSAEAKAMMVRMVVALAVGTRNSTSAPRHLPLALGWIASRTNAGWAPTHPVVLV